MPTDQNFPSFKALNGRDAVEFVDYDRFIFANHIYSWLNKSKDKQA